MTAKNQAPQANSLAEVRLVTDLVVARCDSVEALAAASSLARRQVEYDVQAAELLGLVERSTAGIVATERGKELSQCKPHSAEENQLLRALLLESPALAPVADAILSPIAPDKSQLARLITKEYGYAESTAARRADTIVKWWIYLRFVADTDATLVQLSLFDDVESTENTEEQSARTDSRNHEPPPTSTATSTVEPTALRITPTESPILSTQLTPESEDTELEAMIRPNELAFLRDRFRAGKVVLFTGAGFSLGATATMSGKKGNAVPLGDWFAEDVYELLYPGEPFTSGSLQDVFENAQDRKAKKLLELLIGRFSVEANSLPSWYQPWFDAPWKCCYTLNVDNIERVASLQFNLRRDFLSINGIHHDSYDDDRTPFIHLNGIASDGLDGVTFSGTQFSERISRQEPYYARLVADLLTSSVIFVGSPLQEPILWQHIALRQRSTGQEFRPKSFLVTPGGIDKSRKEKLERHNIIWIRATAEEFARVVLTALKSDFDEGHTTIARRRSEKKGTTIAVAELLGSLSTARMNRTGFLLGDEPCWEDLVSERAARRDQDVALSAKIVRSLSTSNRSSKVRFICVSGTAGSGKTTTMMSAALDLHGPRSLNVGWVGSEAPLFSHLLIKEITRNPELQVLFVDDAGKLGHELHDLIRAVFAQVDRPLVIVLAVRSRSRALIDLQESSEIDVDLFTMERLSDGDIERLLIALKSEGRLGRLASMSHERQKREFRERADRQILVAMIEATSGRKFELRIVEEWDARESRFEKPVYTALSLATSIGFSMSTQEIVLACGNKPEILAAIQALERDLVIAKNESGRYRARHKVVADHLIREIASGYSLSPAIVGVVRAVAVEAIGEDRGRRREANHVVKSLLKHDYLLRVLCGPDAARAVYQQVEEYLPSNHHFWLQRGCLELEFDDLAEARVFLESARSFNGEDPLVRTAFAHLEMRECVRNHRAPDSERRFAEAGDVLKQLVEARGKSDSYPAHVFGTQVIAWTRRASLTPKMRTSLLKEAIEAVESAIVFHKHRLELVTLRDDLRKELMTPNELRGRSR